jgi:hypothetical protein
MNDNYISDSELARFLEAMNAMEKDYNNAVNGSVVYRYGRYWKIKDELRTEVELFEGAADLLSEVVCGVSSDEETITKWLEPAGSPEANAGIWKPAGSQDKKSDIEVAK